jgi:hypothetical protein
MLPFPDPGQESYVPAQIQDDDSFVLQCMTVMLSLECNRMLPALTDETVSPKNTDSPMVHEGIVSNPHLTSGSQPRIRANDESKP